MKIEFCITVEPLIVFVLVCAIIAIYSLKRGYDRSRQRMETKAKQGQRID